MNRAFKMAVAAAAIAAPLALSSAAQAENSSPEQTIVAAAEDLEMEVAQLTGPGGGAQQFESAGSSGSLSYLYPGALAAMPLLLGVWLLLRLIRPEPKPVPSTLTFLFKKLNPQEETPDQTPLWKLWLCTGAVAAGITAAAQPHIDPEEPLAGAGDLLIVVDNGWAAANWQDRAKTMESAIERAEREGRMVAILPAARPGDNGPVHSDGLTTPADAQRLALAMKPMPWPEDREGVLKALEELDDEISQASVLWLSNGLNDDMTEEMAQALAEFGPLTVIEDGPEDKPLVLEPPRTEGEKLEVTVRRAASDKEDRATVIAINAEDGRVPDRVDVHFEAGEEETVAVFNIPTEMRNTLGQIAIEGENSAGAVVLLDERWRRRPVGLIADPAIQSPQPLLDEFYYVDKALAPYAELRRGTVEELLKGEVSVLVLGDSNPVTPGERRLLEEWIENGGTLLRLAGPRLAEQQGHDSLLPVELNTAEGARIIGGPLSGEGGPAKLMPFSEPEHPFFGNGIPEDVTVTKQIRAKQRQNAEFQTWATLEDGTELVTARERGKGKLILFHTTATPDWTTLPMSKLFIDMLRDIVQDSRGVNSAPGVAAGQQALQPMQVLDGTGKLTAPLAGARGLTAEAVGQGIVSPKHPAGLYGNSDNLTAHNLTGNIGALEPLKDLPAGTARKTFEEGKAMDLTGWLIALAVALALTDQAANLKQNGAFPSLGRHREGGGQKNGPAAPAPA